MATEDNKPVDKDEQAKKPVSAPAESESNSFPIERILSENECYALTGIERHKVLGALRGTKKTTLTIDEVSAAVDKWLSSPVKEN
jgi:hypothetical protein